MQKSSLLSKQEKERATQVSTSTWNHAPTRVELDLALTR
jgi:hypothetical protein